MNAWTSYVITSSRRNWLLGHKFLRFVKYVRDCYVLMHLLTDSCHVPLAFQSTFARHAEVLVLTGLWAFEYKSLDDVFVANLNLPNQNAPCSVPVGSYVNMVCNITASWFEGVTASSILLKSESEPHCPYTWFLSSYYFQFTSLESKQACWRFFGYTRMVMKMMRSHTHDIWEKNR